MSGQLLSQRLVSSVVETEVYLRRASGHSAIGRRWRRGEASVSCAGHSSRSSQSAHDLVSVWRRTANARPPAEKVAAAAAASWPRNAGRARCYLETTARPAGLDARMTQRQRWRPPGLDAVGQRILWRRSTNDA